LKRRDTRILRALHTWGPTKVGALARELGIPRRTVYYRLEQLERWGFVTRTFYGPVEVTQLGVGALISELGVARGVLHALGSVDHSLGRGQIGLEHPQGPPTYRRPRRHL